MESAKQDQSDKESENAFIDLLDPEQTSSPRPGNDREVITAFLGLLFLYLLYVKSRMILILMASPYNREWDLNMYAFFFPLAILPVAILFFWLRKKVGWILATFITAYLVVVDVQNAIFAYNFDPGEIGLHDTVALNITPPSVFIATALAIAVILWLLCRSRVRKLYRIDSFTMLVAIGVPILFSLVMFFLKK